MWAETPMFLWKCILFRSAAESSYLGESEAESALLSFLAVAVDAARLPVHETRSHFFDDLDNCELLSAQFHETDTPRWSVCMRRLYGIENFVADCGTSSIVGTIFLLETNKVGVPRNIACLSTSLHSLPWQHNESKQKLRSTPATGCCDA